MSNDSRSKQFLKVLRDECGQPISMLQRVWQQLLAVGLQNDAYICASKAQVDIIESQLGDVPLIVEPERRDTFPAIALSTLCLADSEGLSDDEVVAALPIDPYVDASFFESVAKLEADLRASNADLALIGVRPTEPTSKLGYIRPLAAAANGQAFLSVASFVEKPAHDDAMRLIADGALWNCGVFAFRIRYLRSVLTELGYPNTYEELLQQFSGLVKRSFDYEVVERAKTIVVRPYEGTWKDLGTWSTLCEEIDDDFVGSGTAVASDQTHVINELGIPIVAMGLKGAVVVASPDGILVANKEHSERIKDVIGAFAGRPMYEERRWGMYRVLDYRKLDDGKEVLTRWVELHQGQHLTYQRHQKRSELWTIVEGTAEFALDNRIVTVSAGDVLRVSQNQWHAIRALTPLKFVEVQTGSEVSEEDTIRRFITWNEVVAYCSVVAI